MNTMDNAVVAQKAPFAVDVEAGRKYAWCSCGRSAKQPLCDGTHTQTAFMPIVFTAEKTQTVYLCGCKGTGNQPFCDGTHSSL